MHGLVTVLTKDLTNQTNLIKHDNNNNRPWLSGERQ